MLNPYKTVWTQLYEDGVTVLFGLRRRDNVNIVLAAEEPAGVQMLRSLARTNHQVVAVLAAPPKPQAATVSVARVAWDLGFQTWPAQSVKDPELANRLRSARVDILLNVHSLYIIRDEVLSAPRLGAFNLHPGPLPRYAGLNAVSWALYRGEKTHGVTIHKMDAGIDTGPIVYQSFFPIEASAAALSLSFKCVREGARLMLRLLEVASKEPDRIPLVPQDLRQREYFGNKVPNNGWLSWSSPSRGVINFVRACDYFPFRSPWGHPRTRLGEREVAVAKVEPTGQCCDALPGTVGRSLHSGVQVACSDEWVLVKQVQIENQYVNSVDVLKPGDRFGADTYGHEFHEATCHAGR